MTGAAVPPSTGPPDSRPGDRTEPARPGNRRSRNGNSIVIELVRLSVVVLATVAAFELAEIVPIARDLLDESPSWLVAFTALGAATGYVAGGLFGRFVVGRIEHAERQVHTIAAGELLAAVLGGATGLLVAAGLTWPVLLFEGKRFTVPMAALVIVILTASGVRLGQVRGGDLLRFVGAPGRLAVASPGQGAATKVVDTSALVDGRILDVARAGFLEGTLVVPQFVLYELQGLADAGDEQRRTRGRRGLDVLTGLQHATGVETDDHDYPHVEAVDAKLVALARDRHAGLVTVDGNLARVAEIQGVSVLNLHSLAEQLRPPVIPGDDITVRITRAGKEPGQGVGHLVDGTMVVVEGASQHEGEEVTAAVTSILSNPNGRMVFATLRSP